MGIIVKYWAGYHESKNMINPGYLRNWIKKAEEVEAKEQQLVVFSIPIGSNLIEKIEALIQTEVDGK